MLTISTVIPARNEGGSLGRLLESLTALEPDEVVVADGGSTDDTVAIADSFGAVVLRGGGGVVDQLNTAAAMTRGEALLFLHADSGLPVDPYGPIRRVLGDPAVVAGGFRLDYGPRPRYRVIAAFANLRARLMGVPMGDQGIFIRRRVFERIRGFRQGPLLPDLHLATEARRHGRVALLPERLRSSPRRYEANGLLRNLLANQALILTHFLTRDRAPRWAAAALRHLREPRPAAVQPDGTPPRPAPRPGTSDRSS